MAGFVLVLMAAFLASCAARKPLLVNQGSGSMMMDPDERNQLVSAWIDLHKTEHVSSRHDELFWSFCQLSDLIGKDPETAWDVILEILRRDQSQVICESLSAGPLEDLLAKHGPTFIDRVEYQADRDENIRYLLRGVWRNAMTGEVWERVQRCARELGPKEKQDLVNAWIELQKAPRPSPQYDEFFWSHEELDCLIAEAPEIAWEVILEILRVDQSSAVLVNLSTGPLMELLGNEALVFIERVELEASKSPMFRRLLAGTWQNGMNDDVWRRIQACSDTEGWEEILE